MSDGPRHAGTRHRVLVALAAVAVLAACIDVWIAVGRGDPATAAQAHHWGAVVAGDEFDYVGPPDPDKWNVYDGVGHADRGRRSPAAWSIDGHVATVSGTSLGRTGGMSARFGQRKYGRWETRMRTSSRVPEYHPVLILWPDAGRGTRCPEVDFAEGNEVTSGVNFYLHYGCGGVQTHAERSLDTTQWHNYAVQWTPSGITGYIDGEPWFTDRAPSHQPRGSMHETIQLDWFPTTPETRPSWMQVDWTRTYDLH